jgi:hypothetical protein
MAASLLMNNIECYMTGYLLAEIVCGHGVSDESYVQDHAHSHAAPYIFVSLLMGLLYGLIHDSAPYHLQSQLQEVRLLHEVLRDFIA